MIIGYLDPWGYVICNVGPWSKLPLFRRAFIYCLRESNHAECRQFVDNYPGTAACSDH